MEDATEKKERKFKVGDSVFSPHFGEGIITGIVKSTNYVYPIRVKWTKLVNPNHPSCDCFTLEGKYTVSPLQDPEYDIRSLEESKEKEDGEKMHADGEKFHVGDIVYSLTSGVGVITKIDANENLEYPIVVHWTGAISISFPEYDFFTLAGTFYSDRRVPDKDIVPVEDVDLDEEGTGVVDRMLNALDKKTDDAINPTHYKVKGLPEAHEIMNHLMHREQLEGFYWGNIIKYAYRYGRKGDKAETAGKIAWYAQKLKELGECESNET